MSLNTRQTDCSQLSVAFHVESSVYLWLTTAGELLPGYSVAALGKHTPRTLILQALSIAECAA